MEKDIERYLVEQAKKRGGLCHKWTSMGVRGLPDRILLLPGAYVAFVETKWKSGTLRPAQRVFARVLQKLGFRVYVPRTKEEIDEIYEHYDQTR